MTDEFHASESKITGLAGLGWIEKHNLLVNSEYGSAISLCSVLTDAPLKTVLHKPASPLCGDCTVFKDICQVQAISGTSWIPGVRRDDLENVYSCNSCLMCLALYPWTQDYMFKAYV